MNCGAASAEDELKLDVGTYVVVDKDKKGKVTYVGEDKNTKKCFGPGVYYGVHLSEKRGTMDGSYKGEKFFRCQAGHGVMVLRKRITKILKDSEVDFDFAEWEKILAEEKAKEEKIAQAKKATAMLKALFKKIDTDGNRLIEKGEFVKALDGTLKADEAEKLFGAVDVSKSDTISYAEFDGFVNKIETNAEDGGDEETAQYVELLLKADC